MAVGGGAEVTVPDGGSDGGGPLVDTTVVEDEEDVAGVAESLS